MDHGGFTLPGEAGHEALTLRLAERWGADVIRDSDGTQLSPEILHAGHGIYSTICLIREDRAWAAEHSRLLQQNVLMSFPRVAEGEELVIELLEGFSTDQFVVNDWDGTEFWQVFDRTTGTEVLREQWSIGGEAAVETSADTADSADAADAADAATAPGTVRLTGAVPGHSYTVNFLAMRLWEEISMYNHVTNDWGDRPRLMAVEPRHPEVAEHLLAWLEEWCVTHPDTTVVRFTSLFYNFAWFWGSDPDLPHVYADWGSYDFTVNPIALREFNAGREVPITAEDFVNAGRYTSTHNPPSAIYLEWMAFVGAFVRDLGRRCVDVVHRHGKKAYVFYDDSWIGLEPWSPQFGEMGFDGLIKAVFSGYEARLNAGVDVPVHELRLHPYLFPVNLEGAPTFAPGGDPTADAQSYWTVLRRALLRERIDRIGLGGYLSLVEPFEDFQAYIAGVADEHRLIRSLHEAGAPEVAPVRVAVLTAWGALRSWTCSGHLHESPDLSLLHVIESLAGLPFDVRWLSLAEVATDGVPDDVDVLVNAGPAGTAWSGGPAWADPALTTAVTAFVASGGGLIGVQEPAALDRAEAPGRLHRLQLAPVLGVDQDAGDRRVLSRRRFEVHQHHPVLDGVPHALEHVAAVRGTHLVRAGVDVLAVDGAGLPVATATAFGDGRAVFLADHRHGPASARLLENALWWAAGRERSGWTSSAPEVDVAHFPTAGQVLVASSASSVVTTVLRAPSGAERTLVLAPGELLALPVT
ncbi:1,3-beta-galactosyl-N-acetylhexosamine phosphorylase [Miniimonas arenae]|uniref:1,3-beta-galactosyl-N-acetylhexosamine phosphorylase n=1 Tax=Miniimonas arenae TaxID=676201 RepID=A0A5C5BC94_9MICO|nr:1,3-beta-galactosyl-N-acetylhexosamine phosphorylase [Miniimonas arenae]TNU73595.1 1,3-beta-galactosyl-N-acetylhexosamine phosphorylase [Miniimonas arenae]